jgi:hypothetical protein
MLYRTDHRPTTSSADCSHNVSPKSVELSRRWNMRTDGGTDTSSPFSLDVKNAHRGIVSRDRFLSVSQRRDNFSWTKKVKLSECLHYTKARGGEKVKLYAFLISALDGDDCAPAAVPPVLIRIGKEALWDRELVKNPSRPAQSQTHYNTVSGGTWNEPKRLPRKWNPLKTQWSVKNPFDSNSWRMQRTLCWEMIAAEWLAVVPVTSPRLSLTLAPVVHPHTFHLLLLLFPQFVL